MIHKLSELNRVALEKLQCDSEDVHFGADIYLVVSSQDGQLLLQIKRPARHISGSIGFRYNITQFRGGGVCKAL